MMNGFKLKDVDDNVLEDVDNVNVGVRCIFYMSSSSPWG